MIKAFLCTSFLTICLLSPHAHAGETVEQATRAEALLAEQKPADAWDAMTAASETLWRKIPLAVLNVNIVDSATGYGIYSPRSNNRFKDGGKMIVYFEPIGYGYGKDGLGNNLIEIETRVQIQDKSGKPVTPYFGLGGLKTGTRHFNKEIYIGATISFDKVEAGEFDAIFTLKDKIQDKEANFKISSEIIE